MLTRSPESSTSRRAAMLAVALLAVTAALVPACSSGDSAKADRAAGAAPMSIEQARDWYAALGCDNYAGWSAFGTALRNQTSTAPGTPVDASMVAGATKYRATTSAFTTRLQNPPAPWPSEVADDVEVLTDYNVSVNLPYLEAIIAPNATWPEPIPDAVTNRSGVASREIRLALGAPAFGEGC